MSIDLNLLSIVRSQKIANLCIAVLLSFLIPLQPLVPSISYAMAADLVKYGSQQGQDLWKQIQSQTSFPETAGGKELKLGNGTTIPMNELFQAPKQDDSYRGMYELSNEEFEQRGTDAKASLLANEKSAEGQAYRTLRESAYVSRPDLDNDPMWGSTDAVYGFLAGEDIACTDPDTHTPDYRRCERINVNTNGCTITHDIKIKPSPTDIVFLVDNSGSMGGVIASLRQSISHLVDILSAEDDRDLRLGGAIIRSDNYKTYNVPLSEPQAFQRWINALGTNGGTTYSANAANWALSNFEWRTDPDVERLIVIIGNQDSPGSETSGLMARAAAMDVQLYIFHDHPAQKAMGIDLGNGFSVVGMFNMLKELVEVEDSWSPADCVKTALTDLGATCERSLQVVAGASSDNECQVIGGLNICAGDVVWNKISPSPLPGIPRLARSIQVSEVNCSYSDGNTSCLALEKNPQCGFITSRCADGTPEEMVKTLYEFGLNRTPSASEIAYWAGRIHAGQSYDEVKTEFFRTANVSDEGFINEFSCKTFNETYDCGYTEASNAGACAVQDLFKTDFADCVENLVPTEVTEEVQLKKTETCEETLTLSQCTVQRELLPVARTASQLYTRGCFATEEVSYRIPWAESALSASVSLSVTGTHTSAQIIQQPTLANGWTARVKLIGAADAGSQCPAGSALSVSLYAEGTSVKVTDKETAADVGNTPCLKVSDDWTDTTWTCTEHAPSSVSGLLLNPVTLASALTPIYSGAPATCSKAVATYKTKNYTQGEFCWADIDGTQQCANIDSSNGLAPGTSSCGGLKSRSASGQCTYEGRFPVEGGSGSTGYQYVWEHRYTCVTESKTITRTELAPEYVCSGIVRCMGDECMTPNRESSSSFGKAASMLQAVQEIGQDVTCDVTVHGDMYNCQVFGGEAQTCTQALGGYVDCCESPGGVSLSDYISAAKGTLKLDNYIMNADSMEAIRGAYSTIRQPIAAPVEYVYEAFTQQLDNLSSAVFGEGAAGGAMEAVDAAMAAFKQTMMEGANTLMTEAMGPEVAQMFFQVGADGAVSMTAGFAAALSIIGLIYTIYTIAKLLISIIWKCSEDELGLAVDVDLLKTHYVGSYCAKKSVLGCVEKRQSYCVFSSPLARIINEQARPQLGRNWGTPKTPDCSGITLDEMNRLDWSQIDLGEWMNILNITGNMPGSQDMDIESLTGSGSYLGKLAEKDGVIRPNTADRNAERLDDVDLNELNKKASEDFWRQQ